MRNFIRFPLTAIVLTLVTSCSNDLSEDAPPPPPQEAAPLPDLVVQEGDGLPEALPADLEWLTNDDDPPFASPLAVRGGTFRSWMLSFPLTLRRVGPDSNGSFAGVMRYNQLSPVAFHPVTRRIIPSLATHWAYGADGRSLYYRLNPKARWSDGEPVTADDFVFAVKFMRSKEIVAPWYNNHYTERIRDVKRYDEYTIGIQGATPLPRPEMHYWYSLGPVPEHFHRLGPDWVKEYNWRIEPNTGPYVITELKKGKSITLSRKKDWWANDLTYYRNRFNPDKVRYTVIRDLATAYQHFIKGEIDTFNVVLPQYWHDKAIGEEFDKGYIAKYWFYNQLPVPSGGMFLNSAVPLLSDPNIRFGLAHSMNFDRVIDTVLRGDYDRMPTFQLGFGDYDNHDIAPREFDIDRADFYFDQAGFTERDETGIRMNADGVRLSLRVTYGQPHHTERLVILKEEAKKAGVELNLQQIDNAASFKQMQEKKHEIGWMTWNSSGLSPRYWEHFHSANAGKPQTNNISNHVNPAMDELIMRYRGSSDMEERIDLAMRLEQMVHDSGVVIPSFQVPYTREVAWRWVRLPEWLGTPTSDPLFNANALSAGIYSSGGLFWLDPDRKQETLDAKSEGRAFEPVTVVDETYRSGKRL